jgi:hypothetical protein
MSYGAMIDDIAAEAGIERDKVCRIVELALAQLHRQTMVGASGPTDAVMDACFSFGADAAFHLIGLFACFQAYRGNFDDAADWDELGMRFIPDAYQKGVARIAPWRAERSPERVKYDEYIQE